MRKIKCSEVWGGNRADDTDVSTACVTASLFSRGADGGKGGDIYYFSVCGEEAITRIAIADVVGHGEAVSATSQWLYDSLVARMDNADGGPVLDDVNTLAKAHGYDAITTAQVITLNKMDSSIHYAYAGHPPALIKRQGANGWQKIIIENPDGKNIPLGILDNPHYDERSLPLNSGDMLFLYTDGVIEAPCKDGSLFGLDRLIAILEKNSDVSLDEIKRAVLQELRKNGDMSFAHDDVTFMAVKVH